jgi:hypothetical protein
MYSQPETTQNDWHMNNPWHQEVSDSMRLEAIASQQLRFASVRLEFREDGTINRIINGATELDYPPPSPMLERLIAEKIALLKLAPIGKIIDKVGRRHSEAIYYIRIFPEDVRRMKKLFIRGEFHEV